MKIKKLISAIIVSASLMISGVTAYAKDITMDTDVFQPDEICGYVNLKGTTDADVYLKIYKHTPESKKTGYLVYDTVITADSVHVSNNYVYKLEYNNLNIDKGIYEGYYDVMVGVKKHIASEEKNDIVYHTIKLIVEDVNYSGYETFCNINVSVTDEHLEMPLCVESGAAPNKTYDITFSCISFIQGDANSDNRVDVRDCAYIANMLAQGKSDELTASADFNGDTTTNVRDAAALASHLAGATVKPDNTPTEPTTQPSTDPTETVTTAMSDDNTSTTTTLATAITDPTESVPSVTETTSSYVSATETTETTIFTENSSEPVATESTIANENTKENIAG